MFTGQAWAQRFQSGDLYYNITNDTERTVEVTYQSNYMSPGNYIGINSVYIPETVTYNSINYTVTSIGAGAFEFSYDLKSVSIPHSVTSIKYDAFRYSGLTSITIPNTIVCIDGYTFHQSYSLVEINVEDGNLYYSSEDGVLFNNNKTILIIYPRGKIGASYTIPSSVTELGVGAFFECKNLTSITIPNSVTNIDDEAFGDCSGLTSITIPNSVTTIGDNAFASCSGLTSVLIPNSVTSIGDFAFSHCSGLTLVAIPYSVTSIGTGVFYECRSNPTFYCGAESEPSEWNNNNYNWWFGCSPKGIFWNVSLKITNDYWYNVLSYEIPRKVEIYKYVGDSAKISVPTSVMLDGEEYSVTRIATDAFKGYINLDYNVYDNAYYVGNADNPYLVLISAKNKKIASCEIHNQCSFIYDEAFNGCNNLTEIAIPSSVISINSCFDGCNLTKAGFASIECLCNTHFRNFCSNPLSQAHNLYINDSLIRDLIIPKTVTNISDFAFAGGNFQSTTIPNSVTSIGIGSFSGCSGLTSISIPNSITNISESAFSGCYGLKSINIGNGVTNLINNTLDGCGSLKVIVIGSSVKTIDSYVFGGYCSANLIACLGFDPPTLVQDIFPMSDTIYVRPESVNAYKSAPIWKRKEIMPFYTITAQSTDNTKGIVKGDSLLLGNNPAIIEAVPTENCHFVKWSDGNTDNPRSYSTAKDTSFSAIFEAHTEVTDAAVAATCTEAGKTEGSHCSVCGEVLVAQQTIHVKEHTVVKDGAVAATTSSTGLTEGSHCSVCGKVIVAQKVIPMLDNGGENQGGNDEGGNGNNPTTAVAESAANAVNIYAHGNTIVVENATEEIRVYNAMGALVGRDAINRLRTEIPVNGTGIYLVKVGNVVKRVMVN